MNKIKDDYNWNVEYPEYHLWQTKDTIGRGEQFFLRDYKIVNNKINANIHINQQLLYEFCLDKKPKSIYEVGFGYANNLVNINKILNPRPRSAGCDICVDQYENAKLFCNIDNYGIQFTIGDFLEIPIEEKYELVYSATVLMHMSTQKAKDAIKKMVSISTKYVFIIDGKLPIENYIEYCGQFGKVKTYEEFWDIWTENNAVPILIEI